ncbi:MAG TPA: hypothetical protein VNH63_00870 [Gemmatimonadales bacterium]|nr:hypothetical protein [Gemmatimonadales bacterium]
MLKVWVRNGIRIGGLLLAGAVLVAAPALAGPRPGAQRRTLNLFAGILGRQNANQFDCGLNAFGEVCVDPNGSTTVGGGFWPKGTPDQYVFNSGMQLAGIVDPASGFTWAGDTVGAFFFDPKGTTVHGDKLSLVWSSINKSDLDNWPRDAYVSDTSLYNHVLIGKKAVSQQDSWIQYWDGNPANNSGRKHPLGVLITQRGMAWNFPTGNEAIIYYIYTFTNVTAKNASVYAGLPDADTLASIGTRFQTLNETAFGVAIPDTGYTITNMYAAFAMDADVTDEARKNYTSAFLPFNMGFAYKGTFFEAASSGYKFLPPIFSAPFAQTVGFVGVKYLKSPLKDPTNRALGEVGLTMYSATINGGQFDDAQNTVQLWRYLSAKLSAAAGDAPCSTGPNGAPPSVTHVCYVPQATDDIRFFQSSGPLTLKPGQSQTIVVAYIAAAPVDGPQIAGRSGSFDLKPAFPALDSALVPGHSDTLRSIDHVIGATSIVGDTNGNGKIDQFEVNTTPRSLLNKGLVAQAVFDAHFLLPFPPDPPEFFLVPGDNQVTVVWRASTTEQTGDPFYVVASDNTLPIYDANYRQFDVEGYRIYRGRTTGDLQVVAQFDYSGTAMLDFTGAFNYGNCAPELGVLTDCPADLGTGHAQPLVGDVVQIPPGGRVKLANGNVLVVQADTAVTGGASGRPGLRDSGVPFAFIDKGVKNSFRYFYAVTAFDVNSVASVGPGATSLESAPATKTVTPRAPSGQQTAGSLGAPTVIGANGNPVPALAAPSLDATTGIWSGPQQPTKSAELGLAAFLPEVLTNGSVTLKIDSLSPGNGDPDGLGTGAPVTYYVTTQGAGAPVHLTVPVVTDCCDVINSSVVNFPATAISTSKSTRFGGDSTFSLFGSATLTQAPPWFSSGPGRGDANDDPANSAYNGPRWWTGAPNENTANPNGSNCHPSTGACVPGAMAGKITAGALTGVSVLWNIQAYNTVRSFPMRDLEAVTATVMRAADISVYWGAAGAIDSVVDDVHKVPVPFKNSINASWGILNDSSFVGVTQANTPDANNALLTWGDIFCIAPSPAYTQNCTGTPTAVLQNHARLSPVAATSIALGSTGTLTTTGNGFIFYLNGKFFLMQMAALPSSGTVWHARFYTGNITGTAATNDLTFLPAPRTPAIPGLRVQIAYAGAAFDPTVASSATLATVHTVPDPYYVTNALEQSSNDKILRFVNLPSRCIVRIYSVSGVLVNALTLDDPTGGGELTWNLRNRNNQFVASGVYFYHVETPDGKQKVGRFTVVNFAQ